MLNSDMQFQFKKQKCDLSGVRAPYNGPKRPLEYSVCGYCHWPIGARHDGRGSGGGLGGVGRVGCSGWETEVWNFKKLTD